MQTVFPETAAAAGNECRRDRLAQKCLDAHAIKVKLTKLAALCVFSESQVH
jgi:hypothetical protein